MKNILTIVPFLIYTVIVGYDILDIGNRQSLLVIHYDDLPDDKLLIDYKYLKNKHDIVNVVDKILNQRNAY
jgi:hypothetical protein